MLMNGFDIVYGPFILVTGICAHALLSDVNYLCSNYMHGTFSYMLLDKLRLHSVFMKLIPHS